MSICDVVECPYCMYDFDASEEEFEDKNEIDFECDACGRAFKVVRELVYQYNSYATVDMPCDECGKMVREVNHFTGRTLCTECACKEFNL